MKTDTFRRPLDLRHRSRAGDPLPAERPGQGGGGLGSRPTPVLHPGTPGVRAPQRRRGARHRRTTSGTWPGWSARPAAARGASLHSRPGHPAGLHRRAGGGGSRLAAGGGGPARPGARRRSTRWCPWTWWWTTPSRWTSSASPDAAQTKRGDRVRAQPRALRVPPLGPEGLRQLPGRAPGHRHRPPGQPRVPGEGRDPAPGGGRAAGPARHAGGHRLAHHDDQRPRRSGLGGRGDRGRGRHARPAALHGDAGGGGVPPGGKPARGNDGHRPGAHRGPDASQEGRGGEVRRVLRPGPRRDEPGRPGHDRQHGPGVRRDLRVLPGGRHHPRLPPPDRPPTGARWTSSSATARSRGCSGPPRPRTPSSPTPWSWTWPPWSRASPGPSAPTTGWPCRRCSPRSAPVWWPRCGSAASG